jgi:N utilization substance protein B
MILLKLAIAEFLYFPSIPSKVTINEYLEIAKEYATPKSSTFINGILDVISKDLELDQSADK